MIRCLQTIVVCSRVILLLFLLPTAALFAAGPDVSSIKIAPVPEWAEQVPLDQLKAENKDEAVLLSSQQVRVASSATFFRTVIRMTSAKTVQRFSQLSFSYDPSFQKLLVHYVRIHRDGKIIEIPVASDKFRVVQVESDLDRFLYYGEVSALWFLEDIRVGDILDYAWTEEGRNPVFDGHFMKHLRLDPPVPTAQRSFKIITPLDHPLYLKTFNSKIEPVITENEKEKTYLWLQNHAKPDPRFSGKDEDDSESDDEKDSGKEPSGPPWVQITDFADWNAVRDWSRKYYTVPDCQDPDFLALVKRIKTESPELKDQIKAAIQFVQGEVRYLGIEMGSHSHQPSHPEEVLKRRFGDCKDKAMLLSSLLHALGVTTSPAFVNTEADSESEAMLPTAYAFNHAVCYFTLKGDYYWIDATLPTQRGALEEFYFPSIKRALVPSFKEDPYTYVTPFNKGSSFIEVAENFEALDYQGEASLKTTITYKNNSADTMRAYLLDNDQQKFETSYLKIYQHLYPKILQKGSMEVTDDLEKNILQVKLKYGIPEFWKWSGQYRAWYTLFFAKDIAAAIIPRLYTKEQDRTHVREVMSILVQPSSLQLPETSEIKNDMVEFKTQSRMDGVTMIVEFDYQNRAETLSSAEAAKLSEQLNLIKGDLEFSLYALTARPSAPDPKPAQPVKPTQKKFY